MTVTVRDREAESEQWGMPGAAFPVLRTITIADTCPRCGGPRGVPTKRPFVDDGESYVVDCWENSCGHVDYFTDVIVEGAQRQP